MATSALAKNSIGLGRIVVVHLFVRSFVFTKWSGQAMFGWRPERSQGMKPFRSSIVAFISVITSIMSVGFSFFSLVLISGGSFHMAVKMATGNCWPTRPCQLIS